MVTGDMDVTIRFWRDLIGMRLINGFWQKGFRHYFFEIDDKNTLAFFEWDGAECEGSKAFAVIGHDPDAPIVASKGTTYSMK
jgi:catechol 2,3-dioxygenase-like lactoylglutathione lyase family enzyme